MRAKTVRRSPMPHEPAPAPSLAAPAPLVLAFADLFDHLGTSDVRYGAGLAALHGREIAIDGFLAHSHVPGGSLSLVDQPGLCPDCSPVPAATIALPGARAPLNADAGHGAVRVTGRL